MDKGEGVRRLSWMIVIGCGLIKIFSQSILPEKPSEDNESLP